MGFWKEIRKEGSLLLKNITFSMEEGRRVKFWKDIWYGNNSLREAFPSLFALADSKDAWVIDCWDSLGEKGDGIPVSLDLSIIVRWRRWKDSFRPFKERV